MTYLLDTNACIALIKDDPPGVRRRFDQAVAAHAEILVPTVVAFELWYGVAKSVRREANARRIQNFFAAPIQLLSFDEEDAKSSGAIRAEMESRGKSLGPYDLLIAGQALRHDLILVTANAREFRRIKTLRWEDWATP
jgi:tRNA(fMet)-specific endonuclease VapC|nr:type II toxin-antitoxin system VapC family toxin [Candidatus Acidoferrales bacterium]